MIWVDFLTRRGRKLQLPFMCCLAPFPGRIAPFPALPSSSGTGSAAPADQTEPCGSGRGDAEARVNAPLCPPAPLALGRDRQGGDRLRSFAAVPPSRRGRQGGTRSEQAGRQGGAVQAAPAAPAGSPRSGN